MTTAVLGDPAAWSDLLDDMVPRILAATIEAWHTLPSIPPGWNEDRVTRSLCSALRQHRTARNLPFQIHTQQVKLESADSSAAGRLDIVFNLLVPCEESYFCMEAKRLRVVLRGRTRSYASEYVQFGMMRFITGQYSPAVRHGGMLGYVFDRNIARAVANVQANVGTHHAILRMAPPGDLVQSPLAAPTSWIRESRHRRTHASGTFRIHHVFVAVR